MPPRAPLPAGVVRHLTTEQLGERLGGMAPETLRKWRQAGKGPDYIKTGDGDAAPVLYPLAWVEEWERANRVTCGAA